MDDDDLEAGELAGSVRSSCPYCGEAVELLLDPGGGGRQEYVEDCEVCCRPWAVRLSFDARGRPDVRLEALDLD